MFTKSVLRVRHQGFTIVELLIVITILALLTALAATSYLAAAVRSRDSARKASVNTIAGAVETYYSSQQKFPGDAYVPGQHLVPTTATKGSCESYNTFTTSTGTGETFPYYFYKPNVVCGTSSTDTTISSTYYAYKSAEFKPIGTWIPGLGQYLNPFPSEVKFTNFLNTSLSDSYLSTDPYELLSIKVPTNDPSRSILYRNLSVGYVVYSRLESLDDKDFKIQFSKVQVNQLCLANYPVAITNSDSLSCVQNNSRFPTPILYLISK